jgi:hypothetical protein
MSSSAQKAVRMAAVIVNPSVDRTLQYDWGFVARPGRQE